MKRHLEFVLIVEEPLMRHFSTMLCIAFVALTSTFGLTAAQDQAVGVVSHVKIVSDKVADVSSLEAWKKSFIKEGMSDREKALAAWKTRCDFVYQDIPPIEFLHEACVHDPIKSFNVYGYGMCCCASSNVEALARYLGLEARGWGISGHSVPEVFWDNSWHMLDASLLNYFTKPDGQIASVEEISSAVKAWYEQNPQYKKGGGKSLDSLQRADGWTGWKRGPALLANCAFYDAGGWWPARTHGWSSTMQEFSGAGKTPFAYEYGYSQGYEVNIRLRPGERLTRYWSNSGQHVNGVLKDGVAPGCLNEKVGAGAMAFVTKMGDLTNGRIGSGRHEYEAPLADGSFRQAAIAAENLASTADDKTSPALHVKDAAKEGVLELEMPSSYVYLGGSVSLDAAIGEAGKIGLFFSDNNGLDWQSLATIDSPGKHGIDLRKYVLRRYSYRLRVVMSGRNTGLQSLRFEHDVQCSQRALPTLAQGKNVLRFSAGPQEGTITVEGSTQNDPKGKQVTPNDFHPTLAGVDRPGYRVVGSPAEITFPISTLGEMTRLRFGGHYRARDAKDKWEMLVSFDGGKTFKLVDTAAGPAQGKCKYVTVSDIPAGTRSALVRWSGTQRNTTCLFSLRIDADYKLPHGGFRPVKITYEWEENGAKKSDVHVATRAEESYEINCQGRPVMKSVAMELVK